MPDLTSRECEVLCLIAGGQSTKQIAATLGIAFKTAASHRAHILDKTGACNAANLIYHATRMGLVENPAPGSNHGGRDGIRDRVRMSLAESRDAHSELTLLLARSAQLHEEVRLHGEALRDSITESSKRMSELLKSMRERPLLNRSESADYVL